MSVAGLLDGLPACTALRQFRGFGGGAGGGLLQPPDGRLRMMGPIAVMRPLIRSRAGKQSGQLLLVAMTWGVLLVPAALARQGAPIDGRIPCALATQDSLSTADQKVVKDATEASLARLRSADAETSLRGRNEIVEPLACNGVTVAFRAAYTQALDSSLRELIRGTDLRLAANALLIAGKLKSSGAVPVLRMGLEDQRPAVRLAAASGFKELLAPPLVGLPDRTIDPLLDALAEALSKETNPNVGDVLVAALDAARGSDVLRARANSKLIDALSARIRSIRAGDMAGEWAPAILRGVDGTKNTLIELLGAGGAPDRDFARRAAILGALSLAYVGDRVASGQVTPGSTLDLTLDALASAAEGQIVFAHAPAGGVESIRAVDLRSSYSRAVKDGDPSELQRKLRGWIGSGGLFTREPYNLPAAELSVGG